MIPSGSRCAQFVDDMPHSGCQTASNSSMCAGCIYICIYHIISYDHLVGYNWLQFFLLVKFYVFGG